MNTVSESGYVAVDFYAGSIMYDFQTDRITICDIDLFRKKPSINDMGEDYWGTKRLKAPEEYCYGAAIDEITNVYTLGALLFDSFLVITRKKKFVLAMNKMPFLLAPLNNGNLTEHATMSHAKLSRLKD